jgi:voltage-gated sodium channel
MTSQAESPNTRAKLAASIEAPHAQSLIIALILVNAVILGLETSPTVMANCGSTRPSSRCS